MTTANPLLTREADELQNLFMAFLPRIERRAQMYFRDLRCPARRADCIAETVAIAWKWFAKLMKKGRNAPKFIGAIATLAARAVGSGRRAAGQERSNDVLNPLAQSRHGFVVHSLHINHRSDETSRDRWLKKMLELRLADNTVTRPGEQAQFRIDFPRWVRKLSPRERRILRAMSQNESTKELSRQFHVTAGRISQMRRSFYESWLRFVGDLETDAAAA